MLIRKKKLIKILEQKQLEIRKSNQNVKKKYIEQKDERNARDWQFYEDGNDNAFNYIISLLKRK